MRWFRGRKIHFALIHVMVNWSPWKCVHGMTFVLSCAKFCSDMTPNNGVIVKQLFHRIWITMVKSVVKWATGYARVIIFRKTPHVKVIPQSYFAELGGQPQRTNHKTGICHEVNVLSQETNWVERVTPWDKVFMHVSKCCKSREGCHQLSLCNSSAEKSVCEMWNQNVDFMLTGDCGWSSSHMWGLRLFLSL